MLSKIFNIYNILILIFVIFCISIFTPFKSEAISFSVKISDENYIVKTGDRLNFSADIKFPENPSRMDLRISYKIIQNNIIFYNANVLKAIENQMQFMDYIVVPSTLDSGEALLQVIMSDYNNVIIGNSASVSFTVVKGRDQIKLYTFIILIFILIISIFIAILSYSINKRMKEMAIKI